MKYNVRRHYKNKGWLVGSSVSVSKQKQSKTKINKAHESYLWITL